MKRIVVLGAGESGAGAAVLAKKEGFDVFVSDMSKIADRYKQMLDDRHIEFEEGQHTEEKILSADEIIKSPGIPDTAPMVSKAIAKGIKIISEIEFAGRYTDSKMICITGSNGKTTTTSLIYHISVRQATMPDWLATLAIRWHYRLLRSLISITSSSCRRSSWTICISSAPTSPFC